MTSCQFQARDQDEETKCYSCVVEIKCWSWKIPVLQPLIMLKLHSSNQWLLSLREFDEERDTCEVFMCYFLVKLFISCKGEKETC